ncbi:MAG: PIN domain-containing protein [Candidatus Aminicenantes bacterium]|nr:PIN domain-containing protein [Candidatus Aminicenantes bacterium]
MKVFVDTSGIFALLVKNDSMHSRARKSFDRFAQNKAKLYASSFVLVETTALLHRRIGLDSVRDFNTKILPLLEIIWTDKEWYARAVQRLFLQGQSDISLVDCLSFEIMESYDISLAFAFDRHFEEMGFSVVSSE